MHSYVGRRVDKQAKERLLANIHRKIKREMIIITWKFQIFLKEHAEVVASLAYRDKNPISETLTSVQEYYDHWIFGDPNCGKMQTQFSKLPRTE